MAKYSVERLLCQARASLTPRLVPMQAYVEMGHGATLVDIRHREQRMRDGDIPGALVINRNEFEWRCDPSAPWRSERITPHDYDQRVIVLCGQGYQSSLAAANLQYMGMKNVTDVMGGFEAWRAAGLPILCRTKIEPRHSTEVPSATTQTEALDRCPADGGAQNLIHRRKGAQMVCGQGRPIAFPFE
jgi:rhodanese-related sulfurtransferase